MAITTVDEKLAVMSLGLVFMANIYLNRDALDAEDQKQLLWQYPVPTWSGVVVIHVFFDRLRLGIGL